MTIDVVRSIAVLRRKVKAWREDQQRIALVPTMGALHMGHLSLIKCARRRADKVIVSIFVNPTQFAPSEDFSRYPRQWNADLAMLDAARCDLVFAPSVEDIYPTGFSTSISVAGPASAGLEDRFRPTHFAGVATVVAKLFGQCQPTLAIFGEKDYQQLRVIEHMTRDLDFAVRIFGAPTVREPDGLALSSRNQYLSATERAVAPGLQQTLQICAAAIRQGADPAAAVAQAVAALAALGFAPDYLEARDTETLGVLDGTMQRPIRLLAAATLGRTRLLDNIPV